MTIDEQLQKQVRAVNAVKWIGGGIGLVAAYVATDYYDVSDAGFGIALLGPALTGMALSEWLGKGLACPRCNVDLRQPFRSIMLFRFLAKVRIPSRRCPNCGADFGEYVPHKPIS